MTFTGAPLSSTQYAAQIGAKAEPADINSPMRYIYGKWTCTEAGVGEINMFKLPAGRIRFYPDLSWLISSDMTATANLSIGHRAYVNEDGTVVALDENEWLSAADSGGGALDQNLDDIITSPTLMNSQDGIVVYVTIDTADCDLTDTIEVWFAYTHA